MPIATNIAFSELIKINGRLHEFNFRKRSDILYNVDTADERGTRYMFELHKGNNEWKIFGIGMPDWILNSELKLGEVIEREGAQR